MDPYAPPTARVGEPVPRDPDRPRKSMHHDQRRPGLVWVTQILLVWYIGILVFAIVVVVRNPHTQSSGSTLAWRMMEFPGSLIVLLGLLFHGLVRARRWSWYGGVAFAVLTLVLNVVPMFFKPLNEVHHFNQMQQLVVLSIDILWSCLLAVYLLAFFLSQKVRRFLGVDPVRRG
jgi:hypothetical protein